MSYLFFKDINQEKFDEFVKNGYWENGYENKYLDKVKSMQIGDKIVIKEDADGRYEVDVNGKIGRAHV